MYKLSVPIHLNTVNEETLPVYLDWVQKCHAERVFVCGFGKIFTDESILYTDAERVEKAIDFFQSNGLEVGMWIDAFGHGAGLVHEEGEKSKQGFTLLEGVNGDSVDENFCPLDENFAVAYREAVKKLATMHPDMIMLDDDFRINLRSGYYMGCFCPLHLKEYYTRIGEEIPREQLEALIFTGGKNKYRSAYMNLLKDTMLDFARMLRNAVDEVDETIRLGTCMAPENWDYNGTDGIEIAKAFAGKTKPFLRTIGSPYGCAPYGKGHLSGVIEDSRMQIQWCKGTDVEVFTEGDVYPRPRYNVSSRVLELFDLALIADSAADGILKYMFDYVLKPEYETGYVKRHIHNLKLREDVWEMFHGKQPIGVKVKSVMHRVENWVLPNTCEEKVASKLWRRGHKSMSRDLLARNGIPTTYGESDYPVLICGEHARYVTEDDLKKGAILDIHAAEILTELGIDTGLISAEKATYRSEHFLEEDDTILIYKNTVSLKRIRCSQKAKVLSVFLPDEVPATYIYENEKGQRFFVLAHDLFASDVCADYFNSYYRQAQVISAVEWLGGKKLPAVCPKNPGLYILTSSDGVAMSVALANIFEDEILEPVIQLDCNYQEIRFLNCTGKLDGDKVYLSEISPYGFAAFEVQ